MTQTFTVHFDGKVLIPDEPVQLPVGQTLRVQVNVAEAPAPRFADLSKFAADLPDAPPALVAQYDHYRYGCPKSECGPSRNTP
jgi:hypothetical protein